MATVIDVDVASITLADTPSNSIDETLLPPPNRLVPGEEKKRHTVQRFSSYKMGAHSSLLCSVFIGKKILCGKKNPIIRIFQPNENL